MNGEKEGRSLEKKELKVFKDRPIDAQNSNPTSKRKFLI